MLDIWWLVWAIFIVAIIERKNLLDDSKKWFDLFRVLFELVSAFGGIGLSLGFPSVCNRPLRCACYRYSFAARFRTGQLFILRYHASAFEARDYCYHVSNRDGLFQNL